MLKKHISTIVEIKERGLTGRQRKGHEIPSTIVEIKERGLTKERKDGIWYLSTIVEIKERGLTMAGESEMIKYLQ